MSWRAALMAVMVANGVLTLEILNGWRFETMMQATADASALAAAHDLPDAERAHAAVLRYVWRNMPPAGSGRHIAAPPEITFGDWDPADRTLRPASRQVTAVRVTLHRGGSGVLAPLTARIGLFAPRDSVSAVAYRPLLAGSPALGFPTMPALVE